MKGVQKGVSFLFQQIVEIWWPQIDTLSLHSGLLIKSCCFEYVCVYVYMCDFYLSFFLPSQSFPQQVRIPINTCNKEYNGKGIQLGAKSMYLCHLKPLTSCMWCGTNNLFFLNLSYLICKMWIMISLPIPHTVTVRSKYYNVWFHKNRINYITIKMGRAIIADMGLFHSDTTCMSPFYVKYSFGWDQDSYTSKYSLLEEYEDRRNTCT